MTDLTVNSLIKSYEIGSNVLDGLSFSITAGEHVGILGVNGCGKTTLFKILTGELDYDEGSVSIAPGKRLGLISQIPVYPDGWTVEDVLKSAQHLISSAQRKMADLEQQLAQCSDEKLLQSLLKEYDAAQESFNRLGGYEADSERSRIANGLEIDRSMRQRPFANLSGGEKTRVNLARLILEDTDILLLDEPTNHLDMRATQWLEDYITRFKGTVLAISHDRYFLDRTVTRCIEIKDGKAEFYSGNYSFFVLERQRRFDEQLKQYEKDQAKIEQLTRAADQMHLWAFMGMDKLHKRAFSMEKRIEKLKTTERPEKAKKLSVRFKEADFSGDEVICVSELSKSFGDKKLFSGLELEIIGGESVAIIGDNGTGKSTLIKILMGDELPDRGYTYLGPQVRAAYLPQIVQFEDEARSMVDTMLYECKCTPQSARDRLAAFGFRGENVLTPVGALSGGERSRLKLCMLMGSEINLLILDEPTNHLDIASREWIEDCLADYEGTLLFVSHDRYFIDKFATRIISFDGAGFVSDYKGTYKEYLAYKDRQQIFALNDAHREKEKAKASPQKKSSPSVPSRSAAKLEREIEKLEAELEKLDALANENSSDYIKLMEIDEQRSRLNAGLEELYMQWEEASQ